MRTITLSLLVLVAGLLAVGFISGTVLRHVIQVIVPVVVAVLTVRRVEWASFAALPVFLFWFAIMTLIWLYLLGLSSIASGTL